MALTSTLTTLGERHVAENNGFSGSFICKLGTDAGVAGVGDINIGGIIQNGGIDHELQLTNPSTRNDNDGNAVAIRFTVVDSTNGLSYTAKSIGIYRGNVLIAVAKYEAGDITPWVKVGDSTIGFDFDFPVSGHTGALTLNITNAVTVDLADGSVTTPKIVNRAVIGDKIALDTIRGEHLQSNIVSPSNIDSGTASKKAAIQARIALALDGLVDAANISWNVNTKPNARITLGGNRTINNPDSPVEGRYYILTIVQDTTGNRTLTWGSDYMFTGIGGTPTLSTGASKRDKLAFAYEGGKMRCIAFVEDI